jgi:hypothetical protein
LPFNHNLDLYNDVQLEKLIRKAAEHLEVGTLQDYQSHCRYYKTVGIIPFKANQRTADSQGSKKKILFLQERETAINFLMQPGLIERTNEAIGKVGVIGGRRQPPVDVYHFYIEEASSTQIIAIS